MGANEVSPNLVLKSETIDLSEIKDFSVERDLFDMPGNYFRKVSISYLDEHIDDLADWNHFSLLMGVDYLYLINDRNISNPTMREFGNNRNQRYLSMLRLANINGKIVDS